MIVELTKTVDAPAAAMWRAMGEEFANIANVVSGVYVSELRPGRGVDDAPMVGRTCYTSLGKHPLIETLTVFDPEARRVSYSAKSKSFPAFVRSLTNNWEFVHINNTQTEVRMRLEGDLAFPFNYLMAGMMKARFKKLMPPAIEEIAYYARTGQKHPEKVASDATRKAAKSRAVAANATASPGAG